MIGPKRIGWVSPEMQLPSRHCWLDDFEKRGDSAKRHEKYQQPVQDRSISIQLN